LNSLIHLSPIISRIQRISPEVLLVHEALNLLIQLMLIGRVAGRTGIVVREAGIVGVGGLVPVFFVQMLS
jgi:hypothetical protein